MVLEHNKLSIVQHHRCQYLLVHLLTRLLVALVQASSVAYSSHGTMEGGRREQFREYPKIRGPEKICDKHVLRLFADVCLLCSVSVHVCGYTNH